MLLIREGSQVAPADFFRTLGFCIVHYFKAFCREPSSNAQPFVFNVGLRFVASVKANSAVPRVHVQ